MLTQILKNITRRKTRTILTVSGIAVGVAAIVALGAMGEGMRTGYVSMFSGSGANLIMMQKGSYDITLSGVDEDIIGQVAAVSCGVFADTPVLDLDYEEDSNAEADSNFVLTSDGDIVEIQATGEKRGFTRAEFESLYGLAEKGIGELFDHQRAAIKG